MAKYRKRNISKMDLTPIQHINF